VERSETLSVKLYFGYFTRRRTDGRIDESTGEGCDRRRVVFVVVFVVVVFFVVVCHS